MLNIAITGGGTGGHLAIARAIKDELNQRGVKPIFIGSTKGADREWFENDDGFSQKYFFDTKGVVDRGFLGKISSLLNIFLSTLKCKKIFKKHNIDTVFSVGGYSSAPASFGAILFSKPLYIHEQNSKMGALNRLLSKKAKAIFCSYDENSPIKDYLIDSEFFKLSRIRKEIKTIIFLGGSQGAKAINDFAISIADELKNRDIKIIHQCGKNDMERVTKFYQQNRIQADIFGFTKNIHKKMEKADFAISRAGASTLWALCANRLPTLFIPYPYAFKDHQYYNAKFLEDKNLAFIKRENELTKEYFFNLLESNIEKISTDLEKTISPNGVKDIADYIIRVVEVLRQ